MATDEQINQPVLPYRHGYLYKLSTSGEWQRWWQTQKYLICLLLSQSEVLSFTHKHTNTQAVVCHEWDFPDLLSKPAQRAFARGNQSASGSDPRDRMFYLQSNLNIVPWWLQSYILTRRHADSFELLFQVGEIKMLSESLHSGAMCKLFCITSKNQNFYLTFAPRLCILKLQYS